MKYTENVSKIGIWATQKLPRLNDRKRAHIVNMGTFTIVQPRGFGAAEIPIFESFSVYTENVSKIGIFARKLHH